MASERAKLRRREARCRARLAWQSDKGRAKRELAEWRAAVRVGLAPPAVGASARLLRASTAVEESTFTSALRRLVGLPSRRALAWQRAEVRTQETDWLAVRATYSRDVATVAIRSTHIRVMASLMLRLDGTVRDAR